MTDEWPAPAVATWRAVAELFADGLSALPPGALVAMSFGAAVGVVLAVLEKTLPKNAAQCVPSPSTYASCDVDRRRAQVPQSQRGALRSRVPSRYHVPLFHPRVVRERVAGIDRGLFRRHERTIAAWVERSHAPAMLVEDVFGDVLGYATAARPRDGAWDVVTSASGHGTIGTFADGAQRVVATIALAPASGGSQAAVQRRWDALDAHSDARWLIVASDRELRLYARSHGRSACEVLRLDELAEERGFLRFVALLGRDALLGGPSLDHSPLDEMLAASVRAERAITAQVYSEHRDLRARLWRELRRDHPSVSAIELLSSAQAILDRVLFVAFAAARQLLAPTTLATALDAPGKRWNRLLATFRRVGADLGIAAYDGARLRELEALEVSDETCAALARLGAHDFAEDVSVDVLGHVLEQSISDLERLRREASPTDATQPSKRKLDGVFYTPPFVTSFVVRETLGRAIDDAWDRAGATRATTEEDRVAAWERYRDELRAIRVLDPACGSGAFLIAALDVLAQELDHAERALAELRHPPAPLDVARAVLNENLFGIDKSRDGIEIAKLSLWLKTAERGRPLAFLDRNVRRGNSVVGDPRVDPWAFDWRAGRAALDTAPLGPDEEAIDARWRDGFDVVIGNPPYVRQELLAPYKEHWRSELSTYDGTADLFVYFFERGLQQLKPGGRLGFVVSNKWLRGGYGEKLRALLASRCTIESIVDFGHAPMFPDADAFPCIITLRKREPAADHDVRVTIHPRETLGRALLGSAVLASDDASTQRFAVRQSALDRAGWTLEPPRARALLDKLRRNGVPLAEHAPIKPYYGVKTGCNEAFLVDDETKERLCREHPSSARVLKRYLRGQDLSRWSPEWRGQWMIFARRGIAIDEFPAVRAHLERHRRALEPRPRDHAPGGWPGRKPGSYAWYELQDSVDYHALLEQRKIVYPDILWRGDFCLADAGTYVNNTGYLLPTDDAWILACLNSPAVWSYLWSTAQHAKDEALRMFGEHVARVPIARPLPGAVERVTSAVGAIVAATAAVQSATADVLDVLRLEHDLDAPGPLLPALAWTRSDDFVREVAARRRRQRRIGDLTPAALASLRALFAREAPPILANRARILALEREIAAGIHAAYGLDAADLATLRAHAPPRMPPGW